MNVHGRIIGTEVGQHFIGQGAPMLEPERDQLVIQFATAARFPRAELDISAPTEVDDRQILAAIAAVLGHRVIEFGHGSGFTKRYQFVIGTASGTVPE